MYEKIKRYYELGFWDERKVRNAVIQAVITKKQYKAITGKTYTTE